MPLPPPPAAGFNQDWITRAPCDVARFFKALYRLVGAGHHGHVKLLRGLLGGDFIAHHVDGIGAGADEGQPRICNGLTEGCILAQEAVAGMDGVGAALLGHLNDFIGTQVALCGWSGADAVGLVRIADERHGAVGFGEYGDGLDAHLAGGAHHAQGNLTTIGDEDFLHGGEGKLRALECWNVGVLECWSVGVLERWSVPVPVMPNPETSSGQALFRHLSGKAGAQ